MEFVTLIMLLKLADGSEQIFRRQVAAHLCERLLSNWVAAPPPGGRVVKSVCLSAKEWAPEWAAEKRINGVPLDPEYRPSPSFP